MVAGFAEAARLAVSAGLAGVEINAGQFSLLRQFLSGLTNTRDDEYGTDRLLLARQVLEAVRAAVGPDPIVGLRLGCDELAPWAGITPEMAPGDGATSWPARSTTWWPSGRPPSTSGGTRPDGHTEPGFAVPLAAALRGALPAAGRRGGPGFDRRPDMAEATLAAGSADLVEMTRAQIADPDLARKLADGAPERVRPCVLCNQRCQVRDARNPLVSCIGEPFSGYETEEAFPSGQATTSLDVLVVGGRPGRTRGGPGGRHPGPPGRAGRGRGAAGRDARHGGGRSGTGATWPTWWPGWPPSASASGCASTTGTRHRGRRPWTGDWRPGPGSSCAPGRATTPAWRRATGP